MSLTLTTERELAGVLAELVEVEQVPVEGHFFDDLGADSLVMARFCARVRKRSDLPSVSMQDIYRYPTIRSLAAALADITDDPVEPPRPAPVVEREPASTKQYVLCGALQAMFYLGSAYVAAVVGVRGYEWIVAATGLAATYRRAVVFGGVTLLALCILPIVAKWMLIGRWSRQEIPVWSLGYVRFWVVKILIQSSPWRLFLGSPLYVLYLKALGADIGRGVAIFSGAMPVCTDLLTIGDGTVIRKDSYFSCYRAQAGVIQTGAVTLGRNVVVSEQTVLDIETSMGDGAQLGHASSLHTGQSVPDGEHWHGSPAQRSDVDYTLVGPSECTKARKVLYSALQLLYLVVLDLPLAIGGSGLLLDSFPQLAAYLDTGSQGVTNWTFYSDALAVSFVIFFGAVCLGLAVVTTVPRLLNLAVKPDTVYPLYGFHYGVHRAITRLTNIKFFSMLFGDSSAVVHYLRGLGYDLSPVVQTGSNFGTNFKHETPFLVSIGSGTMVADGLSVMNADFSSTSFRLSPVSIGPRSFLGNTVVYPPRGRTGDNCLLATKVMVPIDGPVRENTGLLGSPCFEIPRSVQRDGRFDHLATGEEFRRRLAAKNRYNLRNMGLFLFVRWLHFFLVTVIALAGASFYGRFGAVAVAAASVLIAVGSVAFFVATERAVTGRAMTPQYCSIYQPYFWWHERYWKMTTDIHFINGTPFKGLVWRLSGVRIGRRVFDDGCDIPERTLVTVGDDCMLNLKSEMQCHSQEDGTFKLDRITIGAGCTLGVGALVHYGVTMGDGAVLAADSFLMKGEEVPPGDQWGGNPARPMSEHTGASLLIGATVS